jgi:hypothetical protein
VLEGVEAGQVDALVVDRARVEAAREQIGNDATEADEERKLDQKRPAPEVLKTPKPRRRACADTHRNSPRLSLTEVPHAVISPSFWAGQIVRPRSALFKGREFTTHWNADQRAATSAGT